MRAVNGTRYLVRRIAIALASLGSVAGAQQTAAKYQEVVDLHYASSSYRTVKRWLAEKR